MKFRTKRKIAAEMMKALKSAYADLNATEPYGDDWDNVSQAVGRYDGLKTGYLILTGRSAIDVGNEVGGWYITTDAYQASKDERS